MIPYEPTSKQAPLPGGRKGRERQLFLSLSPKGSPCARPGALNYLHLLKLTVISCHRPMGSSIRVYFLQLCGRVVFRCVRRGQDAVIVRCGRSRDPCASLLQAWPWRQNLAGLRRGEPGKSGGIDMPGWSSASFLSAREVFHLIGKGNAVMRMQLVRQRRLLYTLLPGHTGKTHN